MGLARTGRWLDVMVLKVFSSLSDSVAAQVFGVKERTPWPEPSAPRVRAPPPALSPSPFRVGASLAAGHGPVPDPCSGGEALGVGVVSPCGGTKQRYTPLFQAIRYGACGVEEVKHNPLLPGQCRRLPCSYQQLLDGGLLQPSVLGGVQHHREAFVGGLGVAELNLILKQEEKHIREGRLCPPPRCPPTCIQRSPRLM